ncbi:MULTISPECIES: Insertion element protein [Amycolatopsis]|uniref:Insertion element protein n=1 Tax=Amycolatopsis methanolica 239 TaxID=1068978 RepID=A0A076MMA0_AMYME|nr:Insertion element protein [Amycolatopsis methanolica]AIJ21983.1 hypothetical protein AMETH_1891 [Amycolatopsis methanolica 239]
MTAQERATPFHCPYCGDEDLRPEEDGAWLCGACRRVFTVKFIGLRFPEGASK